MFIYSGFHVAVLAVHFYLTGFVFVSISISIVIFTNYLDLVKWSRDTREAHDDVDDLLAIDS